MSTSRIIHFDARAFAKLRRIAPNLLESARRSKSPIASARPLPEELSFKLTNRCDLRCVHCYQWNEGGYHRRMNPADRGTDLDIEIIERALRATQGLKSNIYLWGGEPLVYRDWDRLIELLSEDRRWLSICTNGNLIRRRIESLMQISDQLEMVVSLDGFAQDHDALRGKGSFRQALKGLKLLADRKRRGDFRGEITVNCVMQDSMIGRLHLFAEFIESIGVDTLFLSYPWHLNREAAAHMDGYVADHLGWLELSRIGGRASWHSYNFSLNTAHIDDLSKDLDQVDALNGTLRIRYNPQLPRQELAEFLSGSDRPANGMTRCQSIRSRMDIFPDGSVVSCKFYPEFKVADLGDDNFEEAWNGERFNSVRRTVIEQGLMPACAKCNLLYTRGA